MLPDRADVIVVGAGPTGLLLAIELQRRGVDTLVIDLHDRPLTWDRATVIHPRSLEVLDVVGLAEPLIEEAALARRAHVYSGGEELGSLDLSDSGSRYPFNLGVSEEFTERILTEHLGSLGASVTRGARLVAVDDARTVADSVEGIVATIDVHGNQSTVEASWLVGCDGFHSASRQFVGIDMETLDTDRTWVVFDATLDPWDPDDFDTHAHFDDPVTLVTALPERRWRIYVHGEAAASDPVGSSLAVLRGGEPALRALDIENVTPFTCHTQIADRYRAGRVLLAGDAAHVCSPAQGHGMNCGLQDAMNLGWKLALVVTGSADHELLDSYEAERRPIAERYLREGRDSEAVFAASYGATRDERDAAIRSQLTDPTTRHLEIVAEAERDADLRSSPIVRGDPERTMSGGDLLPQSLEVDVTSTQCEAHARLAVGLRHTVLLVAGHDAPDAPVNSLVDEVDRWVVDSEIADRLVVGRVGSGDDDRRRRRLEGVSRSIGPVTIDAAAAQQLDVGARDVVMYAVRPDGWVGLRADSAHVEALSDYASQLTAMAT